MIKTEVLTLQKLEGSGLSKDDEYFDYFCGEEDDQDLEDQSYVIGTLKINGSIYTIIHGFPGDNPQGVIFNQHERHRVGETIDISGPIGNWYDLVTNGCCNYDQNFWYPPSYNFRSSGDGKVGGNKTLCLKKV